MSSRLRKKQSGNYLNQNIDQDNIELLSLLSTLRQDLINEFNTISQYEAHINAINIQEICDTLRHIRNEEIEHTIELLELIQKYEKEYKIINNDNVKLAEVYESFIYLNPTPEEVKKIIDEDPYKAFRGILCEDGDLYVWHSAIDYAYARDYIVKDLSKKGLHFFLNNDKFEVNILNEYKDVEQIKQILRSYMNKLQTLQKIDIITIKYINNGNDLTINYNELF